MLVCSWSGNHRATLKKLEAQCHVQVNFQETRVEERYLLSVGRELRTEWLPTEVLVLVASDAFSVGPERKVLEELRRSELVAVRDAKREIGFEHAWGSFGSGPGQLKHPLGVAISGDHVLSLIHI